MGPRRYLQPLLGLAIALSAAIPATAQNAAESAIIFRSPNGRVLTERDLSKASGPVRYEVLGPKNIPAEATALHEQARAAGGRGDYRSAIDLLEKAAALAPDWAYPIYDLAFTHLLLKDAPAALQAYRQTVKLSPRGFFTALTAVDALEREAKGELPEGLYLAYLGLEWMESPAAKQSAARTLTEKVPAFAPGWKALSAFAENDQTSLAVLEKGLAASPDGETRGILTINKALVLSRTGQRPEAIRLLGELALDPASTYGTEHLAKQTLAGLLRK